MSRTQRVAIGLPVAVLVVAGAAHVVTDVVYTLWWRRVKRLAS